jgi:FKBP-type peptidyl-prolyl cis-trans isomerase SlyD
MKLEANTVGSIIFTLRAGSYDGDIIEKIPEVEPFEFIYGIDTMLPAFEEKLGGLEAGEEFKFFIKSEDAYGSYQEGMQVEFDKSLFVDSKGNYLEEEVVLDNYIPMNDEEGNQLNGKVVLIEDNMVKLDFNHPLADMDLYFEGKVLGVRKANTDEIEHQHVHTQWEAAGPDDPQVCHV